MSDREELRDAHGRLLGYRRESGGRVAGADSSGRLKGWYNPLADETRHPPGRPVGRGEPVNNPIPGPR